MAAAKVLIEKIAFRESIRITRFCRIRVAGQALAITAYIANEEDFCAAVGGSVSAAALHLAFGVHFTWMPPRMLRVQ